MTQPGTMHFAREAEHRTTAMRLAYLVTHPIQYQAPLLRRIAREPDIHLKVFFASDVSIRSFFDPAFKQSIQWDVPLLEGYEYEFLACRRNKGADFFLAASKLPDSPRGSRPGTSTRFGSTAICGGITGLRWPQQSASE